MLFAFVPFHWLRSINHLHLNALYVVPLVIMVAVWIYKEELALFDCKGSKRSLFNFRGSKVVTAVIVCAVTAVTQAYFAFFGCFFLLVSGASAAIARRTIRPLLTSVVFVALIGALLTAALSPRFLYNYHHGSNAKVAKRLPAEAEIFGLKLIQLLLPVPRHRIDSLAEVAATYRKEPTPLVNENVTAALGLVGSIGFLILLWMVLFRTVSDVENRTDRLSKTLDILAGMNLAGFLYGTIGGFSSLFAFAISPQVRAVNRISVFIAFFAFGAIACVLDRIKGRLGQGLRGKATAVFL